MSTPEKDPPQEPVNWWKDKAVLSALGAIAAGIIGIVQKNWGVWISAHTPFDLATWTADKVASWFVGVPTTLIGAYFLRRRMRSGRDPKNPAPPVQGGVIAQNIIGTEPMESEYAKILRADYEKKSQEELLADYKRKCREERELAAKQKADGG